MRVDDGIVVCSYCGKEALIRHTMFLHRPKAQPAISHGTASQQRAARPSFRSTRRASRSSTPWAIVGLACAISVAGIGFIAYRDMASSEYEDTAQESTRKIVDSFGSDFAIYDANGDGIEDLVSSFRIYNSELSRSIERIGAFSGKNKEKLWETETFEKPPNIHLHSDRLFAADSKLGLTMLDAKTGAVVHKLAVEDRITEYCDQPSGQATWVALADETGLLINHSDGESTALNERPDYCGLDSHRHHECRDKSSGVQCEEWEPSTDIIKKPFVYVESRKKCLKLNPKSSSAWMHAGKCRRKKIDGMSGDLLLHHEGSFVVIGKKSPGTEFPMIASVDDQTLGWKRLIDRGPVENRETSPWGWSPSLGAFADGQFILVYKDKLGLKLLSIDMKTGEDRYLVPIEGSDSRRLHLSSSRIYVYGVNDPIRIYDPATGSSLGAFGG